MSQHSPFPSSNRSLSFARNGHSPHASGTPGSSGLDGQPRPTDIDHLIFHSFGNASSIASGFLGDLDIANSSSVQSTMGPPDDRARFAGLEYDRLFQFYHDQDEPWNQEKSRVRGQHDPLPSSFTGFRDTVAPSECETSIGPGTLQSDSGYGSQARQSVGIPSVYGEVDRSSEAIMNQLAGFQMPSESIPGSSQVHDVNHLGHSWNQVTLGRPDVVQANNTPKFQCQHCPKTFRSQSDHKKHTARHEKPHKCPERGCSKATKGFGTINDLERHLKSVHRKDGTRYRCHHGSCLTKAKDWPRPDNFRSHLKKIHNISLEAGDSLEDYIYRSVNPEILSNVGVSLELVPPAVHGSPAPHSWSQLERDTHVHRSGIGGSSEELLLDRRDVYLPPPAHPRFTNTSGLDNHDASSSSGFRYSRSRLEPQQDHDRDLVEDDNVLHVASDRNQDLPRSREMAHQNVPSEENVEYVRPDDLNKASHGTLEQPSPAEDPETEAIVLDEDDEVGASDGIDSNDDDFQVKSLSSPGTATKLPESVNKFDPAAVEDGAKQHKQQAVTGSLEDSGSDSDDLVKPGTPLPLGEAFATLSEELDETDPERAEAAFQKLMLKLGDTRMEKLLRTHGYVKPKGPQARQKSASQQLPIACLEPGCPKSFNRPCEMKKHLKRHEKPYGCTQCQKRFGSKNDWKRHENSQHFQHEIWKCEEKLNTPLSDTCNKVCHRRETFKQHLVSHHGIDSQRLEDKLDRCRIGRLGEARFWCGFCKDVIELETEKNAHDACNARYNHIDDHYSGRNGAVKREAGEWQFGDSDAAEAETKAPLQGDEAKEEMAALPQVSELRKRSRHGSGPTPKRARFSPPREDIMWYCCQCNNPWSFANNPSCISCPRHMRCGDCRVEEIEPTEAGPSGDAE